jgi:hypothetical protein
MLTAQLFCGRTPSVGESTGEIIRAKGRFGPVRAHCVSDEDPRMYPRRSSFKITSHSLLWTLLSDMLRLGSSARCVTTLSLCVHAPSLTVAAAMAAARLMIGLV